MSAEKIDVPVVVRTAPVRIWLQIADDAYSATEAFPCDALDQITWCADSVMDTEVEYVRADLVAELIEAARGCIEATSLRGSPRRARILAALARVQGGDA